MFEFVKANPKEHVIMLYKPIFIIHGVKIAILTYFSLSFDHINAKRKLRTIQKPDKSLG